MERTSMFSLVPHELKLIILSHLDTSDYMALISTSKNMRNELPDTWHISYRQGCRVLSTIFHRWKNVFITGPGGCGKSYTIERIKFWAFKQGVKFACLAPTGIAAYNVSGQTIHSFFPIDRKVYWNSRKVLSEKLQDLELLIIDEISMVGCQLASQINDILQEYRRNERPFGGIQVVFSGDFFQLPPVKDKMLYGSDLWKSLKLVRKNFLIPMRQKGDLRFFNLLNRIRIGEITDMDIELLKRRDIDGMETLSYERMTHLYFRNEDVKAKNEKEFSKIAGEEIFLQSHDGVEEKHKENWREVALPDWEDVYKKTKTYTHKFSQRLSLKIGALYYITTNIDVRKGLVNGTLCTLRSIEYNRIGIEYKGGFTWIYRVEKEFLFNNGKSKLVRFQFPLMLGYALTVHSSQGCTFDRIVFDISKVTNRALLYVGLSRVKKLKDLYLIGVDNNNIRKVLTK